jgi:hypothetical protein
MKHIITPFLIILLLGLTSACSALPIKEADLSPNLESMGDSKYIPGKIYVKFTEEQKITYEKDVKTLVNRLERESPQLTNSIESKKLFNAYPGFKNYELKKQFGLDRWIIIDIPRSIDVEEEAMKWAELEEVESAEPIIRARLTEVPNDPMLELQWQHNNLGENPPGVPGADLDSLKAWNLEIGSGVLVATTEFVEWYHEDLVDNVWQNLNEDADRDGHVLEWDENSERYIFDPDDIDYQDGTEWNGYQDNGYADDFVGWNFIDGTNNPSTESSQDGHGTATSGCLAATTNNSIGVSGTCWNCKLIAISSLNGFVDEQGIEYAVDNGVQVISRSYHSGPENDLVNYGESQGTLFVSSAGNDHSPEVNEGCINEKVLCVSATNPYDELASFTSYGAEVDIGAPGIYVYTLTHTNGYTSFGGTSASTPLVSGVVGLIKSLNPNLSNPEIISIVQSSGEPFNNPAHYAGNGRINANTALTLTKKTLRAGSFPIALIDAKQTDMDDGNLAIIGTATSPSFSHYELWQSTEKPEVKPRLIYRGYTEVENGILGTLVGTLPEIINSTITLKVYDSYRQIAKDTYKKEDNGIVLSKKFSERGIYADGDKEYDYLSINTSAYIQEEGNYTLLAYLALEDGMELIDNLYETRYLEEGMNDIEVFFDGYKIFHTGINGPYSMSGFALNKDGGEIGDSFYGNFYTADYDYTKFENIIYHDPMFYFVNGDINGDSILRYLEINNPVIDDFFRWAFGSIPATMEEIADIIIATYQIIDEQNNIEFFGTKFKESQYEEEMSITSHYEIYYPDERRIGKLRLYSVMANQPHWEFDESKVEPKIQYDDFLGNPRLNWKIYSCEDYNYEELKCDLPWREIPANASITIGDLTSLSISAETEFKEAFALGHRVGKPPEHPEIMEMSDILDPPL